MKTYSRANTTCQIFIYIQQPTLWSWANLNRCTLVTRIYKDWSKFRIMIFKNHNLILKLVNNQVFLKLDRRSYQARNLEHMRALHNLDWTPQVKMLINQFYLNHHNNPNSINMRSRYCWEYESWNLNTSTHQIIKS